MGESRVQEEFLDRYLNAEDIWTEYQSRKNRTGIRRFLADLLRDMREETSVPIEPYEGEREDTQAVKTDRRLSRRTVASLVVLCLLTPLTIAFGIIFLADRKYVFISVVLLFYAMFPFFMVFEGRKPQAREMIVIAVLGALTVAGRSAFFMLPHCKPIAAMVIVSAVTFGPESGFLVGCLSMVLSNFLFGQGPWTPWQMASFGLIGFLAGVLFRKGLLSRTRPALCAYGFLSVIFIYGGIMNPASLIMYTSRITWKGILAMYISGIPVDLVHATSTVLFLWFGAQPMIEKLERIKKKYGLISH
jgi:uncharacterized membrane protein